MSSMMASLPCRQWFCVPAPRRPFDALSTTPSLLCQRGRCVGRVTSSQTADRGAANSASITAKAASRSTTVRAVSFSCAQACSRPRTQAFVSPMTVDRLEMLDEALRRRINPHRLHAGVGIERIGVSAERLVHLVLEQAVDQDHVPAGELLAAGHFLLDELAVVNDELHIEGFHAAAGLALAAVRLFED